MQLRVPLIQPYLSLLRQNRSYRWLWMSQVISRLGDWFNLIATTALVSSLTGSGLAVSFLFVARTLPPFLLGPVVGVVADRFDRRRILFASDVMRAIIVLGFLLVRSESDVWLIYTLTLLQLSVSAFFEPTRAAMMPSLVKHEDLVTANALDGATWSAMLAIGAALGGVVAALFGLQTAFILDALTYLLSAFFITRIRFSMEDSDEPVVVGQPGLRGFLDGLGYLKQYPHILALTLVKGLTALAYGAIDVVQVDFAENVFVIGDNSSATLGLIYTAIGLGTGLAPLIANRYTGYNHQLMRLAILTAFATSVVGFLVVAWSPTLLLLLVGTIIRATGSGIAWVYSSALLQLTVDRQFRGRVFAFDWTFYTLSMIASTLGAGFGYDSLGMNARSVTFACAVVAMVTLFGWSIYHVFQRRQALAQETGV